MYTVITNSRRAIALDGIYENIEVPAKMNVHRNVLVKTDGVYNTKNNLSAVLANMAYQAHLRTVRRNIQYETH